MKMTEKLFVTTGLLAFAATAQDVPPAPPPPPPTPQAAPAPPAPHPPLPPRALSLDQLLDSVQDLEMQAPALRDSIDMLRSAPMAAQFDQLREEMNNLRALAPLAPMPPMPPIPPRAAFAPLAMAWAEAAEQEPTPPPAPPAPQDMRDLQRAKRETMRSKPRDREDQYYRAGQAHLDRHEYDKAIDSFNQVIDNQGPRADGALYWRAYAQNKLGRRDDALAGIAELRKTFPNSHWLEDAKALEVEARSQSGQPVSPEAGDDEDLKLLAINSLMNNDPDRSIPLIEKLLKSSASPRIKERALFVLAQSHSPQARTLMAQVARGASNPDLQLKAVEYLGVFGGKDNLQTLVDVYRSSNDIPVKHAILRSFMVSGSRDNLLTAAKSESNPDLKIEAIRQLGNIGGSSDLAQLYPNESSVDVRREIIRALFVSGNSDKLIELAKSEKDVNLRKEAIRQLGVMGRSKTGPALVAMYQQESDAGIKKTIVDGLFVQGNASALVDLARKETDPAMKKQIVSKLAIMQSKEATDYMMELLNK